MSKDPRFKLKAGKNQIIPAERTDESRGKNISEPLNSTVTLSHQGNVSTDTKRYAELQADIEAAWEGMRDFSW